MVLSGTTERQCQDPLSRRPQGTFWRRWLPAMVKLGMVVIIALFLGEGYRILIGKNVHCVIPGRVYRCAQPTPEQLREYVEHYGIRTIVNLRGSWPNMGWYRDEATATCDLDICQEDLTLSAGRIPSVSEVLRMVEILEHAEYPIMLHCRRGADRTGLVAAAAVLLEPDSSLLDAYVQLSPRYGHIPLGSPGRMAMFLGFYEEWLEKENLEHLPEVFRRYLLEGYRGAHCNVHFEGVDLPEDIRVNEPFCVMVHARNVGSLPWRLSRLKNAGQHLLYIVKDDKGNRILEDRAGFVDAVVPVGGTFDFTIPICGIAEPGRYRMHVDMNDEMLGCFFQIGSKPIEIKFDVHE